METLNLLLKLIHGISVAEDADDQPISFLDLAACLVFVMREVFTGFHKWRYTGLKDREEIGMIIVHQTGFSSIRFCDLLVLSACNVKIVFFHLVLNFMQ